MKNAGNESESHRELKRLGLAWIQAQGCRVAALEVAIPNRGVRIDVAGCSWSRGASAPTTVILECKAFAADFRKDARCAEALRRRLAVLRQRQERVEAEMCIHFPSIRTGDSLFPEFQTLDFERPGYERYQKIVEESRRLSSRLHANTKFDRLMTYRSANLYYIAAEPGVVREHELPVGWGLLQRSGDSLEIITKPQWHDEAAADRIAFFQRVAMAATRAVNREANVSFEEIVQARRGF